MLMLILLRSVSGPPAGIFAPSLLNQFHDQFTGGAAWFPAMRYAAGQIRPMIRFRYQPTLEHYFALNRIVLWRQSRLLIIVAAVLLVIYLIQPFIVPHEEGVWEMYRAGWMMLILPCILFFSFVSTRWAVRKRWDAAEEIRMDREYEIDETGVRVTGSSLSGFMEWRHFIRADCLNGYFLLKTAQNQYHYFPASIVPDQQALNVLLKSKVSAGKQAKSSRRRWLPVAVWFAIVLVVVILYFSSSPPK